MLKELTTVFVVAATISTSSTALAHDTCAPRIQTTEELIGTIKAAEEFTQKTLSTLYEDFIFNEFFDTQKVEQLCSSFKYFSLRLKILGAYKENKNAAQRTFGFSNEAAALLSQDLKNTITCLNEAKFAYEHLTSEILEEIRENRETIFDDTPRISVRKFNISMTTKVDKKKPGILSSPEMRSKMREWLDHLASQADTARGYQRTLFPTNLTCK